MTTAFNVIAKATAQQHIFSVATTKQWLPHRRRLLCERKLRTQFGRMGERQSMSTSKSVMGSFGSPLG